ncbi:adenosylcobinamide amidohydrolase [Wukongibacter sp. M2B1]|uniref:adenosylcobinamide amidohydrolase n=1 Tax=Wukongibacter sp. M2B1 TaxID=3088895 RepID=UPI003D7973A0
MINISSKSMLKNIKLDTSPHHVHIGFNSNVEILSSAILNGGYILGNHILNMKVPKNTKEDELNFEPPEITLNKYASKHNWKGTCVGMMTAASMNSFRNKAVYYRDVIVESFITLGLSNARRAGDAADIKHFCDEELEPGTINIIIGTNARLSSAAMIEAVMIAAEAKAGIMQELNIISPVSNKLATGTGTDSIAIFNGFERKIKYCGKHVILGEMIALAVSEAIKQSVNGAKNITF